MSPGCLAAWLLGPWLLVLGVATPAAPEHQRDAEGQGPWRVGQERSIAVRQGRSRFSIPSRSDDSATLLVVSSMARAPGPFPVTLKATPAAIAATPETLLIEPAGPPRLKRHSPEPLREPKPGSPVARRDFHLMVRDGDVTAAENYVAVRGVLRAVGRRVQVYVAAEDTGRVTPAVLREIVETFDDKVVPAAARAVGLAEDTDGDGRFTVLISSWLARLGDGRNSVDGFVRVTDLDPSYAPPFGNRCDMMYLSTNLAPGPHLRTVVAHEYMHAVVFSKKLHQQAGLRPVVVEEEGWLDEALAHLFEDLVGFSRSNIDYRASAFLAQPERYQLLVEDYYAAGLFRSHGNRGSTYLFLRWCVDQYGPDLVPTLAQSGLRGVANLEQATGCSFRELYRRWSVSLFLDGLDAKRVPETSATMPGAWPLAGPRARWLEPGVAIDRWDAAGTSSHFIVVPQRSSGVIEITITGPSEAELQVTAVPLPSDLGRLDLETQPEGPGQGLRLEATIRQPGQTRTAMTLQALTWEPLVPPADPHGPGASRGRLDGPALASFLGAETLTSSGPFRSQIWNRPSPGVSTIPLVVRLLATDAKGRRLAGWTVLGSPPSSRDSLDSRPIATRTR